MENIITVSTHLPGTAGATGPQGPQGIKGATGPIAPVLTGSISEYSSLAAVPTGYLLCNGQAVSRTTYSALFAIIGTSYGFGNNTTTFNVPNYSVVNNVCHIIKT